MELFLIRHAESKNNVRKNDFERLPDVKERSLRYSGMKKYLILRLPQRPGALKDFLNKVLGPNDDITFFEYSKKSLKKKNFF